MEYEKIAVLGLVLLVAALGAVVLMNEQLAQGNAQGMASRRAIGYQSLPPKIIVQTAQARGGLGACCAPSPKWPPCAAGLECRGWNVPGHATFGTCTRAGAPMAAQINGPAFCGV